ncbi:MAG TPA: AAA family ATPase [Holosporales bacterium]|nr:AAA family ATPase [Holosporales bacterium]HBW24143.1 AAA family ATPase [Holosporales bacterium]HCC23903.1 AAA family ATPase [Holosporales bacterium]HCE95414.1 AAA family ATPase [Holosporales bacterium]
MDLVSSFFILKIIKLSWSKKQEKSQKHQIYRLPKKCIANACCAVYIIILFSATNISRIYSVEPIIGRKKEIRLLREKLTSKSAEFIAIYGRRRVGKTYLIKQFFTKETGTYFEQTGLNDGSMQAQLLIFSESLSKSFYKGAKLAIPENWMEALKQLTAAIDSLPKDERITLFFDELPWLATKKSGFLKALEYYWNTDWTYRQKLILVVCGSAASWIIENLIYAKGGLHNRITARISLQQFNLAETEAYLEYLDIKLNRQQILQLYMAIGGIPYYIKSVRHGLSATQNINELCFSKDGPLFNEFDILFHSLYEDPETYINIIRVIADKSHGISREDLILKTNMSDGGYLNTRLRSLESAGFISTFLPVGHARRGVHYRVTDEYTLFYLTWIEPIRQKTIGLTITEHYWESLIRKPVWYSWAGYAFETVCFKHVDAIKKAINLERIPALCSDWQYRPEKKDKDGVGAQIDLVFDRDDGCVTLCEIKYTEVPFVMTKEYAEKLNKKGDVYKIRTRSKKQIFWALISANGVVPNEHVKKMIDHIATLDDLFQM